MTFQPCRGKKSGRLKFKLRFKQHQQQIESTLVELIRLNFYVARAQPVYFISLAPPPRDGAPLHEIIISHYSLFRDIIFLLHLCFQN